MKGFTLKGSVKRKKNFSWRKNDDNEKNLWRDREALYTSPTNYIYLVFKLHQGQEYFYLALRTGSLRLPPDPEES